MPGQDSTLRQLLLGQCTLLPEVRNLSSQVTLIQSNADLMLGGGNRKPSSLQGNGLLFTQAPFRKLTDVLYQHAIAIARPGASRRFLDAVAFAYKSGELKERRIFFEPNGQLRVALRIGRFYEFRLVFDITESRVFKRILRTNEVLQGLQFNATTIFGSREIRMESGDRERIGVWNIHKYTPEDLFTFELLLEGVGSADLVITRADGEELPRQPLEGELGYTVVAIPKGTYNFAIEPTSW